MQPFTSASLAHAQLLVPNVYHLMAAQWPV